MDSDTLWVVRGCTQRTKEVVEFLYFKGYSSAILLMLLGGLAHDSMLLRNLKLTLCHLYLQRSLRRDRQPW